MIADGRRFGMLNRSVAEHLTEDTAFLWLIRNHMVHAPNVRLTNLVRFDERLSAQIDALATTDRVREEQPPAGADSTGDLFLDIALRTTAGVPLTLAPQTDESVLGSYVAALTWIRRDAAFRTGDTLRRSADPVARAIAIAAFGTRRAEPGQVLIAALDDPSPLVRARAYRTTAQLGRVDLMAQLDAGLRADDEECRFWSAWATTRMGATEALEILAEIAWNNLPRADRALDLLLRRLDVPEANAWLRDFAKLPDRQRDLIRATGMIGDPLYIPWLLERMTTPETARLAGEAFSMLTGLDLAYHDLDRRPPADFQSGPNDDPTDENVALDEDENLPWPDPEKIGNWWAANRTRFNVGTAYFLGTPKAAANWLEALSDAYQRQRHAAALELAIRQPDKAMFEVRARGRLQRQSIARARGRA